MGNFTFVQIAILISIVMNIFGMFTDGKEIDPKDYAVRVFTLRMSFFCFAFALLGACIKLGW